MSNPHAPDPSGPDDLITFPEAAAALGLPITRVHQLVREGELLARVRDGVRMVPLDFVVDGQPVKGLRGVVTLLRDAHYDDDEALQWLYTEDESLPGSPVAALRRNRGTEVRRRAQALGF